MNGMTECLDIVVLTHFASPYQIELFDEIARRKPDGFKVYYMHRTHPTRSWQGRQPRHPARFLNDTPGALKEARTDFNSARFAVISFYNERAAAEILRVRVRSGLPWCLWGERPGFRSRILGGFLRRWTLRALHKSQVPIWGMGRWAVDGYREEFGSAREYIDLPYFSDLSRFFVNSPSAPSNVVEFIFSGAFSHRKGVDLMCRSFARLAKANANVRLKLMGRGELEGVMKSVLKSCRDQVEWLGFRDWSGLPTAYASAHVLCAPSRYDGWGLVVPEGLASALPVIGTDRTGATLEFISNGKNGWVTTAGSEESLYEAMLRAATLTGAQWLEMSTCARDSVKGHTLEDGAMRFLAAAEAAADRADVAERQSRG